MGEEAALSQLTRIFVQYGLDLSHAHAAAHLQPAPLALAVAADALASVSNASLDTYDSGPSAIALERWLIRALARLAELLAAALALAVTSIALHRRLKLRTRAERPTRDAPLALGA